METCVSFVSHSCDEQGNHVPRGEEEAGGPQGGPVRVGGRRGDPQPEADRQHGPDLQVSRHMLAQTGPASAGSGKKEPWLLSWQHPALANTIDFPP